MFKKFLRALNQHLEEYLIALFLIAITFVMLLQIVMRYVFQHSLSWPEEFSRYCFVYITFLTFGYCIQHDSMLRLDKSLGCTSGYSYPNLSSIFSHHAFILF